MAESLKSLVSVEDPQQSNGKINEQVEKNAYSYSMIEIDSYRFLKIMFLHVMKYIKNRLSYLKIGKKDSERDISPYTILQMN